MKTDMKGISFNPSQSSIISHKTGPALVIAGAGSGKTLAITQRVVQLIRDGISPSSILLLTFTNKASREMMERVQHLLGQDSNASSIIGGTFHSIANRFLRRYPQAVGFESNFTILDTSDAKDLIKTILNEMVAKENRKTFPKPQNLQNLFSLAFNQNVDLETFIVTSYTYLQKYSDTILNIFKEYKSRKYKMNVMDFDDLLHYFSILLENKETFSSLNQIKYILVDEYQDTNCIQSNIIQKLSKPLNNLMVVGDDAQSIYGWRGARCENILEFKHQYPNVAVYYLETNYRSTQTILDLANASIHLNKNQFEKTLVSKRASNVFPIWNEFFSTKNEAEWIVNKIVELQGKGISLSEICILYRAHRHVNMIQILLQQFNIPYQIRSGIPFFEKAHIKDILAILKVCYNPLDMLCWKRILRLFSGIGEISSNKLIQYIIENPLEFKCANSKLHEKIPAKAKESWKQFFDLYLEICESKDVFFMISKIVEIFYESILKTTWEDHAERKQEIKTLVDQSLAYESLESFIQDFSLDKDVSVTSATQHEQNANSVLLTTIHQAKGLEWNTVFVIGLNQGMFPSEQSLYDERTIEEERRLFYVAITRAKNQLYLTSSKYVTLFGQSTYFNVSKFIEELDESLLEKQHSHTYSTQNY